VKITVTYLLSDVGQRLALREGRSAAQEQTVEGEVDVAALDIPGVRINEKGEVSAHYTSSGCSERDAAEKALYYVERVDSAEHALALMRAAVEKRRAEEATKASARVRRRRSV
jgi:hypothetical protein